MEIILLPQAEDDLNYWKEKGDARILKLSYPGKS
jgi:hypothetical protein